MADAVVENEVDATCTTAGSYDSVVYCSVCNEEISRETIKVDALGHTAADTVKENEVAATCTTAGSYDMVVYCSVCEEEISRESFTVDALGHDFVDGECSRAQDVTFLWRAKGSPASSAEISFSDVKYNQYYSIAVAWAIENGITTGPEAGIFGVDAICNRAQAVTFLYRTYSNN